MDHTIPQRYLSIASLVLCSYCGGAAFAQSPAYSPDRQDVILANRVSGGQVPVVVPRKWLLPREVMVIANGSDPQSVLVRDYYQQARGIPTDNVITLNFDTSASIHYSDMLPIKEQVELAAAELAAAAIPTRIQAFVLAWRWPSEVHGDVDTNRGYGMTHFFSHPFVEDDYTNPDKFVDEAGFSLESPYYYSNTLTPYEDFGMRFTMALPGITFQDVADLIDRGVASDLTFPGIGASEASGWLMRTNDPARSVRHEDFLPTANIWNQLGRLDMNYVDNSNGVDLGNHVANENNILFYFTGFIYVPEIDTNMFLPGAIADHMTSAGGNPRDPQTEPFDAMHQMSALRWLEGGVTGTYGTVSEPRNFQERFPRASLLIPSYYQGETLLQAYAKSVRQPQLGQFSGEPLARPFGSVARVDAQGTLRILTTSLEPGKIYTLWEGASLGGGGFTIVQDNIKVTQRGAANIVQPNAGGAYILTEEDDLTLPEYIAAGEANDFESTATSPHTDGESVVWVRSPVDGDNEIHLYDLANNAQTQITSPPADPLRVKVSNGVLAWEDERHGQSGDTDLYILDTSAQQPQEVRLTPTSTALVNIALDSEFVVWTSPRTGTIAVDVFVYELPAGPTTQVLSNRSVTGQGIDIDNGIIAFSEFPNPPQAFARVSAYDIRSDELIEVTTANDEFISFPSISNHKLTWIARSSIGVASRLLHDLALSSTTQIPVEPTPTAGDLSWNLLSYTQDSGPDSTAQIHVYNIEDDVSQIISYVDPDHPMKENGDISEIPVVARNKVVWAQETNERPRVAITSVDEGDYPTCWHSVSQCHGDANNDGQIGGVDFVILDAARGFSFGDPQYDACADFDRDGSVCNDDFGTLIQNSNNPPTTLCSGGGTWPPPAPSPCP